MNTVQAIEQAVQLHLAGRFGEAQALYRRVLEAEPGNPTALHLSGVIAHREGDLARAEALIRAAVLRAPRYAEACNNLGNLLRDAGRAEEALDWHRSALEINSDDCETWFSLGLTCQALNRPADACEAYLRAVTLRPGYGAAWVNLGNALEREGNGDEALACFRRAVEALPESAEAHYNLARLLQGAGSAEEAEAHYLRALEADPRLAQGWYNLGILRQRREQVDEAVACFRRALEIAPDYAEALNNLAGALKARGETDEAVACYRRALALRPDDGEIFSNLLLALNYVSGADPGAVLALHRDFAARFEGKPAPGWPKHDNAPEPERRLRIAYLSPDFRRHPVANFIEPVLRRHDRSRFEVWCLYSHPAADGETAHLKSLADHWRDIAGASDEEVAQGIQGEGIDILVDLAGHTAGNRLGVFARKPAPVQATWLGYLNTTGLAAMDWRITDAEADPAGAEARYAEALMRLSHSQWCYRPFDGMPAPGPLPALSDGRVTFGSFNNAAKISAETLALWARVLRETEGSRLLLVGVPEGEARRRIAAAFHGRGVDPARVDFRGKLSLSGYWEAFSQADIALDTFPYNGGTTTCDALWLGLPVVTLSGGSAVSRGGRSLLAALGRGEWIADTADEYVGIARTLAGDVSALARTRAGLRQAMQASPVMDERTFTLDLEMAYRQMWRHWCRAGSRP